MKKMLLFLTAGLMVTGSLYPAAFEFSEKKLTVKSSIMELVIDAGAVMSLKNLKTGEVFTNKDLQGQADDVFKKSKDVRAGSDSDAEFRQVSADEGDITYKTLINGDAGDSCIYKIKINNTTGEIGIQTVYHLSDASKTPAAIPVVNITGKSVILGRGVEHFRNDPPVTDYSVRLANNLFAPPVSVIEGEKTCIFFYPDTFNGRGNVVLNHKKECDNLLLTSERNYKETDKKTTTSLLWTLGIFPDWFEAAKHYRNLFKETTGARFLWENNCQWFRNIHAVHTGMPPGGHSPTPEAADNYYKTLAGITDPARTLLFYWNGNGIVLFGDHRYMTSLGRPKPHVVDALKKYGFRWFAYHPYDLVFAPHRVEARLEQTKNTQGWGLPEGYTFQPDYAGKPEDFYKYFRDVAAGYYGELDTSKNLWVLHPGSSKVRDYIVRNYGNYCKFHRADGAYLDILGTDSSHHFPEDRKIIDGSNYRDGKAAFLSEANKKYPDLPIMSECLGEWTVPYVPYTWEGNGHFYHPTAPPMNHPLRTAIWGSFTWARESAHTPYQAALVGALPDLDINDEWSIARAKLFNDAGLHNDLPDRWDEGLIAHYRSSDGRVYQYRKMPFGEAFVESVRGKYITRLGMFKGIYESPMAEPAKITNWVGYKNNKPVGLNPAAEYPFTLESPSAGDTYTVSGLPEKAFITGIRHGRKWSVLEVGTAEEKALTGEITVVFHRDCLRVITGEKDIPGPFKAGEEKKFGVTLPDGLVFVWEEPEAVDCRFRSNLVTETGRTLATGMQDRQWAYNSFIGTRNVTFNNITWPAIDIGFGKYRGYSEGWVDIVKGAEPILKFDIGYPVPEKGRSPEVEAGVFVNGRQVWKQVVKAGKDWQPQEISLKGFTGRKVLVTLSAEVPGNADIPAGPAHSPVSFGRVRVDNNPGSLETKTGKELPKPAVIIFAEYFDGEKLAGEWKPDISPANGDAGKVEVKNGMLALASKHYKYCYVYRELPGESNENLSVQARIKVSPTGGSTGWNPGIALYWENGRYVSITAGGYLQTDNGKIAMRGYIGREIPLTEDRLFVTDDNMYDFWVKIGLGTEKVRCFYSVDGKTWKTAAEAARPKDVSGAPKLVVAGSGNTGEGKYFSNDERWDTGVRTSYISEIIAGKE